MPSSSYSRLRCRSRTWRERETAGRDISLRVSNQLLATGPGSSRLCCSALLYLLHYNIISEAIWTGTTEAIWTGTAFFIYILARISAQYDFCTPITAHHIRRKLHSNNSSPHSQKLHSNNSPPHSQKITFQ